MMFLNHKKRLFSSFLFLLICALPLNSFSIGIASSSPGNFTNNGTTTNPIQNKTQSIPPIFPYYAPKTPINNQNSITQQISNYNASNKSIKTNTITSESISNTQQSNDNYTLGSVQKFWVENLYAASTTKFQQGDWAVGMYQINAKLLNITKNAYIFVDQNSTYYQDYVNGLAAQIGQVFQNKIYPSDSRLGTPINIGQYNQNGKIIILIFDFIEGNLHPDIYTTGYFWSLQMHTPSVDQSSLYYYSDYKEIININSKYIHYENNNIKAIAPTLAHECFHLIHYNYNQNEDLWLEEGMAVFAEHLAGYKSGYTSYLQDTNGNGYFLHANDESLTYFGQTLEHYGASFLFVLYMYQRFGLSFIRDIVQFRDLSGINAIKYELSVKEPSISFDQFYSDWTITNMINEYQVNSTYSYVNFTYRISQSEYNVDNKLPIVPSQLQNQLLPFWSNQFYTLPRGNLKTYLATFIPDIPNNDSQYQLNVITINNGSYSFQKIPLVNNQAGSFTVQYENRSQYLLKVLEISSLTGFSSGGLSIDDSQLFTTYFSRYNLYLDSYSYRLAFDLLNPKSFYPTYSFTVYSANGQILPKNSIQQMTLQVMKWNTNSPISGITQNITYNSQTQQWILDKSNFVNLSLGQYYFTLAIKLSTGSTFTSKGLTFLLGIGDLSSTTTNTGSKGLPIDPITPFIAIFALIGITLEKRKKR